MSIQTGSVPWYKEINKKQWKALVAAGLGWALDSMDVMLYSMVIVEIMKELEFTTQTGGFLASLTLISSAIGGIIFGMVADKIGRTRSLMASILIYSIFTVAVGFSQTITQLAIFRFLLGLGMGGEWVSGAALITESWPAKHRGKAMGFVQANWAVGYAFAALITALIMPRFGWRAVFFAGIIPAFVTFWIRRNTEEPKIWEEEKKKYIKEGKKDSAIKGFAEIFSKEYLRLTILTSLLSSFAMFAYWGLFTWIPGYLASPVEKGGAGLDILKSSIWIIIMQVGAYFGYVTFGFIADKIGRKFSFILYFVISAILVPIYGNTTDSTMLLIIGPFLAFFGSGYFSGFGAILAELYPTKIRATAQGFVYNIGRGFSAFAPFVVGTLALTFGLGAAFWVTSAAFLLGVLSVLLLPETKGKLLN